MIRTSSVFILQILAASTFVGAAPSTSTAPSTQPARPEGIPKDWVQVKAKNAFTFWCPPDIKEIPIQGIDSYVGQYDSSKFKISFDFGWYSNKLDDPRYKREAIKLDGKDAFLARAEKTVGIYVPKVDETGQNKLQMSITCDAAAIEDAFKILLSVRFPAVAAGRTGT